MKKLMSTWMLIFSSIILFAQQLGNPAIIGQPNRNQKVGKGLYITDTTITNGVVISKNLATDNSATQVKAKASNGTDVWRDVSSIAGGGGYWTELANHLYNTTREKQVKLLADSIYLGDTTLFNGVYRITPIDSITISDTAYASTTYAYRYSDSLFKIKYLDNKSFVYDHTVDTVNASLEGWNVTYATGLQAYHQCFSGDSAFIDTIYVRIKGSGNCNIINTPADTVKFFFTSSVFGSVAILPNSGFTAVGTTSPGVWDVTIKVPIGSFMQILNLAVDTIGFAWNDAATFKIDYFKIWYDFACTASVDTGFLYCGSDGQIHKKTASASSADLGLFSGTQAVNSNRNWDPTDAGKLLTLAPNVTLSLSGSIPFPNGTLVGVQRGQDSRFQTKNGGPNFYVVQDGDPTLEVILMQVIGGAFVPISTQFVPKRGGGSGDTLITLLDAAFNNDFDLQQSIADTATNIRNDLGGGVSQTALNDTASAIRSAIVPAPLHAYPLTNFQVAHGAIGSMFSPDTIRGDNNFTYNYIKRMFTVGDSANNHQGTYFQVSDTSKYIQSIGYHGGTSAYISKFTRGSDSLISLDTKDYNYSSPTTYTINCTSINAQNITVAVTIDFILNDSVYDITNGSSGRIIFEGVCDDVFSASVLGGSANPNFPLAENDSVFNVTQNTRKKLSSTGKIHHFFNWSDDRGHTGIFYGGCYYYQSVYNLPVAYDKSITGFNDSALHNVGDVWIIQVSPTKIKGLLVDYSNDTAKYGLDTTNITFSGKQNSIGIHAASVFVGTGLYAFFSNTSATGSQFFYFNPAGKRYRYLIATDQTHKLIQNGVYSEGDSIFNCMQSDTTNVRLVAVGHSETNFITVDTNKITIRTPALLPQINSVTNIGSNTKVFDTLFVNKLIIKEPVYKVYQAKLTQSGTADPTVTEYVNELGATLTWTRTGTGEYTVTTSPDAFTLFKTHFFIEANRNPMEDKVYQQTSAHSIVLTTNVLSVSIATLIATATDSRLSFALVEIRVYQ